MLPDQVSNPGPLTYESDALPIALRGPAERRERRRCGVVRVAWLWCRKSPEGRELKTGLRHPTTAKLSLSTHQNWVLSFELGKNKVRKERDGICLC